MKRLMLALCLLVGLVSLNGCEKVHAEPGRVLWSEADAAKALNDSFAAQQQQQQQSSDKILTSVASVADLVVGVERKLDAIDSKVSALALSPAPAPKVNDFDQYVAPPASVCIKIGGVDQDLQPFLDRWYSRPWTYPGRIDDHLAEHGVARDDLVGLDKPTKEKLHAAIHEKELAQTPTFKVVPATKAPQAAKVIQSSPAVRSNCPGGICPNPQSNWTYPQSSRRGLFGRRR